MPYDRIQKVLSQAGFGSRREIERLIREGLILINGSVPQLGDPIKPHDKIQLKGKYIQNPLQHDLKTRILIYNKPIGEISSRSDPKHERTVFDALPSLKQGRWVQIGRLDINTSGLLIFTNNGELANRFMHPKYQLEREYAVRVYGEVSQEVLKVLLKGVELDDGIAKFQHIEYRGGEGTNYWYHVIISEGRNREVRRLWASQGVTVSRLIRVRYGNIMLPHSLPRGKWLELTSQEVAKIEQEHA